jgi:hypothetical protein
MASQGTLYTPLVAAPLTLSHPVAVLIIALTITVKCSETNRQSECMIQQTNCSNRCHDDSHPSIPQLTLKHGCLLYELYFVCRTVPQAEQLSRVTDIQLALNLSLRHEVLVEKCCGRRICAHCRKNYNIADIYLPASGDRWGAGLELHGAVERFVSTPAT